MRRLFALLSFAMAVAALISPGVSRAQDVVSLGRMTLGYTYFNRVGADWKSHNEDVIACAEEAARLSSIDEVMTPKTAIFEQVVAAFLSDVGHRASSAAGLENCMVVRGWRVILLPESEGASIAALSAKDVADRLTPWIGAAEPHGRMVRTWRNDAASGATERWVMRSNTTKRGNLSLIAATSADLSQFFSPTVFPKILVSGTMDRKWANRPLNAKQLSMAPEGSAIILLQVKGISMHYGVGLEFVRKGGEFNIPPSRADHSPDRLTAWKSPMFANKNGDMFVFAVPPGLWKLDTVSQLNLCLGAPAFRVEAGDVVYAGSFDIAGPDIGPDMDMAPARTWLAGLPQEHALRPAAYVNGVRGFCSGFSMYALEVTGAPFVPGYRWGGAANTPPATKVDTPSATPATSPPVSDRPHG